MQQTKKKYKGSPIVTFRADDETQKLIDAGMQQSGFKSKAELIKAALKRFIERESN